MSDPLCRDCQDLRREVKATRYVGKTPVCDAHMRQRLGQKIFGAAVAHLEPTKPEEEKEMPKSAKLEAAEIEQIKKDAAAGKSFSEIAEKFGVSWGTVQYHVGKKGKKLAGGGENCTRGEWQWPREERRRRRRCAVSRGVHGFRARCDLACLTA